MPGIEKFVILVVESSWIGMQSGTSPSIAIAVPLTLAAMVFWNASNAPAPGALVEKHPVTVYWLPIIDPAPVYSLQAYPEIVLLAPVFLKLSVDIRCDII